MSIAFSTDNQAKTTNGAKEALRYRVVSVWLYSILVLIAAMVVVGGATRLTDSGLSITEWKPILGAIPPLSEADWQDAFAKYRLIPEYQEINKGMSMSEFQFIFWWEWGHRFLGRIIGLAFFIPAAIFWVLGWLPSPLKVRVAMLFVLGGLQGVVGWWMVTSGLVDRVDVSQYRLAVHLTLACILFAGVLWVVLGLQPKEAEVAPIGLKTFSFVMMGLVLFQIFTGALVAGLDAGLSYNTWPLMDDAIVPDGLFIQSPWWINMFENVKTVQFDHRMIAYGIWVLALVHAALWTIKTNNRGSKLRAWLLFASVCGQAYLGIQTILWAVPLDYALYHQFGALVVLGIAVWQCRRMVGGYSFLHSHQFNQR